MPGMKMFVMNPRYRLLVDEPQCVGKDFFQRLRYHTKR